MIPILTNRCRRGDEVLVMFLGLRWVLVGRTVSGKPPPKLNFFR